MNAALAEEMAKAISAMPHCSAVAVPATGREDKYLVRVIRHYPHLSQEHYDAFSSFPALCMRVVMKGMGHAG